MLVVVMHNNREYLESLSKIAATEGIIERAIVEQKKIGTRLVGGTGEVILSKGSNINAYNKAFMAVIPGEDKTDYFLDLIENNSDLEMLNLQNKGFICTVPFKHISEFRLETPKLRKEEGKEMQAIDLLKRDRMILDLKAINKAEAVKELGDLLKNTGEILNWSRFIQDVFERESLSTTGIGNEVAIPHARTDAVADFVIAFGRSQTGIEFESIDDKPVKLIFLMGTPNGKGVNSYLKILAQLNRVLGKVEFRNALMKASTPEDIISEFKKVFAQ